MRLGSYNHSYSFIPFALHTFLHCYLSYSYPYYLIILFSLFSYICLHLLSYTYLYFLSIYIYTYLYSLLFTYSLPTFILLSLFPIIYLFIYSVCSVSAFFFYPKCSLLCFLSHLARLFHLSSRFSPPSITKHSFAILHSPIKCCALSLPSLQNIHFIFFSSQYPLCISILERTLISSYPPHPLFPSSDLPISFLI